MGPLCWVCWLAAELVTLTDIQSQFSSAFCYTSCAGLVLFIFFLLTFYRLHGPPLFSLSCWGISLDSFYFLVILIILCFPYLNLALVILIGST